MNLTQHRAEWYPLLVEFVEDKRHVNQPPPPSKCPIQQLQIMPPDSNFFLKSISSVPFNSAKTEPL